MAVAAHTDRPVRHRATATDPVLGYASHAKSSGQRWHIPTAVLLGLIRVESAGNANAVSSAGAFGSTQFMPGTAAKYGVKPDDIASQVEGAAHYLHDLGFSDDPAHALNAYNGAQTISGRPNPYAGNVLSAAKRYGDVSVTAAAPTDNTGGSPDTGGDVLAAHGSGALHGLVWGALVIGGGTLLALGLSRASGLRKPHGAIA